MPKWMQQRSKVDNVSSRFEYPRQRIISNEIPAGILAKLVSSFENAGVEKRVKLAAALGSIDAPEAHGKLIQLIRGDPRFEVRGTAVRALANLEKLSGRKSQTAGEELLKVATGDRSHWVRAIAAEKLAAFMHYPEIAFGACQALHAPDQKSSFVRSKLIQSIAFSGDPHLVRHLLPFLEDPNKNTRSDAVRTLVRLGAPEGVEYALNLLNDKRSRIARQNGVCVLSGWLKKMEPSERTARVTKALAGTYLKEEGKKGNAPNRRPGEIGWDYSTGGSTEENHLAAELRQVIFDDAHEITPHFQQLPKETIKRIEEAYERHLLKDYDGQLKDYENLHASVVPLEKPTLEDARKKAKEKREKYKQGAASRIFRQLVARKNKGKPSEDDIPF
ncbi:MAG: HEAT repeat domain-containing protein [Candidatus Micrarchaeia archaeon]